MATDNPTAEVATCAVIYLIYKQLRDNWPPFVHSPVIFSSLGPLTFVGLQGGGLQGADDQGACCRWLSPRHPADGVDDAAIRQLIVALEADEFAGACATIDRKGTRL